MNGGGHVPVLLEPALDALALKENGTYIDGTFGRGGHSRAILDRLGSRGRLLAIDRDPAAIAAAPAELIDDPRFELIRGELAELATHMEARKLTGKIDGVLLDLGVSSPQLDDARRGFSFRHDGPLDMRMDPDSGVAASDWLQTVDEKTLTRVIRQFGEETHAARIARAIVAVRSESALATTLQLAAAVEAAVPAGRYRPGPKKHPATKTFQAIRIFLNDELEQLRSVLSQSLHLLATGGRLAVISFHSLEDRIVKRFMREMARESEQYRGMPDVPAEFRPRLSLVGKAVSASDKEIAANPRARSARLRTAQRL